MSVDEIWLSAHGPRPCIVSSIVRHRDPFIRLNPFVTTLYHAVDRTMKIYSNEEPICRNAFKAIHSHTRRIITSVALMRAAAAWPGLSCISRADLAVMMEMICWFPIESVTSAMSPLMRTSSIRPTS